MDDQLNAAIIDELGLSKVSPEVQEATLAAIGEMIMKELLLSLYEQLPNETITDIDDKVEKGDMEGLLEYIETNIPDHEGFLERASQKVIGQFKEKLEKSAREKTS